ncbi:uncharacterized protein LOC108672180 [Hyalella azteca]|uniref:Uncharacterized protein LOC108672180 n=1 Tax=Hyalella azteca TaxID=294128 RepID=A0A8B7NNM8_HYAAZ|nr:uncharacterized protein LOC108672180 [Hyalella azteca]
MGSLMMAFLILALFSVAYADYAMEGETFSLKCESADPVQYWMLHGRGAAYEAGLTYEDIDISVDSDGVLHFADVKTEHAGDHLCVTRTSGVAGGTRGVTVAMKVRPRPSENLWQDMYKAQFVTALISALVCAFVFTAGCLVFRYRYREPKPVLLNGADELGHNNPALDIDSESFNTKM